MNGFDHAQQKPTKREILHRFKEAYLVRQILKGLPTTYNNVTLSRPEMRKRAIELTNRLDITEHTVKVMHVLRNGVNDYKFNMQRGSLHERINNFNQEGLEFTLKDKDVMYVTDVRVRLGLLKALPNGEYSLEESTFADPVLFGAFAPQLEQLYNGRTSFRAGKKIKLENYPLENFEVVPNRQRTAADQDSRNSNNYQSAWVEMTPGDVLLGSEGAQPIITVPYSQNIQREVVVPDEYHVLIYEARGYNAFDATDWIKQNNVLIFNR